MKNNWNDYIKIGIVHFMAFPETIKGEGPVLETVKKIVDDEFFKVIEITWIKDDEVRGKVKQILKSSGITVAFGSQPPLLVNKLNLNHPEKAEREKAVNQVKLSIDEAIFMEACGVGVLSGTDPGESGREDGRKLLIDSLKEICAYSKEKSGPPIVLEPFDRGIGKNCLIGPSDEACEVAEEVRGEFPNFGLLMDLSHFPLLGETSDYALKKAASYLKHIHIGSCVMKDSQHPAYGDEHPVFGISEGENGVSELADFLKTLMEIGYIKEGGGNIVSFEVKPFGDQTSEEVIESSRETFISAWEKL